MENSRTKNSIRNMIWGILNRLVSILFPFIVRTIFIKVLGEEYLGLNSLYSSILQVLNLADLGFASAIVASMYKPIAENNEKEICALLNLYKKIYRVIGLAILIVGSILTPFIAKFINGIPPEGINIYYLWMLYLANTVVSYLFFAYKVSLLNAYQRNDLTEKIGALCRALISVIQIIVIVVMKSVYLYVILTIVCSVVYNLLCAYESKKRYPQYRCIGQLSVSAKKEITRNVGALAIQKIGNTVSLSLDSIIISSFLGLTTVAIYGNYFYIISAVSTFVTLIYGAITASIGNSIVVETVEKNYQDFRKFLFLNTWLIGWCCTCFMCLFQDFMILWMGEDLLFSIGIIATLVIRFFFERIRNVVLTYKDAAGMWWIDKWRPLVGCIVNLILNVILVQKIGVAGVAISTIASYVLVEIPWEVHALFKNYFKRSEIEYYKNILLYIVCVFVACAITYVLCELIPLTGILAIIVK
ncbi:MAG: lipopolysaccharide biosynthesis protein, partial [Faecalibacillus intestinalis]